MNKETLANLYNHNLYNFYKLLKKNFIFSLLIYICQE